MIGEYPDTPEGRLNKHIRATIAEFEREKITERMVRGRRNKARAGHAVTHGKQPYGYRLTKVDGKQTLKIYDPEARVVRTIFDWYIDDALSMRNIAQKLTETCTPTWADVHNGYKKRKRGEWTRSTVRRILTNELYTGTLHYGRNVRPEAEWIAVSVPAIVSQETFSAAQERKQRNKEMAKRNRQYEYLLSGRLQCGKCGSLMYGTSKHNGYRRYLYYRCSATRGAGVAGLQCDEAYWRADRVDAVAWDWVKSFMTDPATMAEGLKAQQDEWEAASKPLRERLSVTEDLLASNRVKLERFLDLYLAGEFPKEMLTERKARLETTIEALERERERLTAQLDAQTLTDKQVQNVKDFAEKVMDGLEITGHNFERQQQIMEILNIRAVLTAEDGQRVVYLSCILGAGTLPIVPTTLES